MQRLVGLWSLYIRPDGRFALTGTSSGISAARADGETASGGGTADLWDLTSQQKIRTFVTDVVNSVAFSPDRHWYSRDRATPMWDCGTKPLAKRFVPLKGLP